MEKPFEAREIMINIQGKPTFAVRIDSTIYKGNGANYVYVQNGDIRFSSSWLNDITPYELGNESHRLAKEIFTIGLQAAVKTKIYELKQLESILKDLNLAECLGNIMVDNTKLLLEVSEKMERQQQEIINEVRPAVEEAITETIRPIAIKKKIPAKKREE